MITIIIYADKISHKKTSVNPFLKIILPDTSRTRADALGESEAAAVPKHKFCKNPKP